MKKYLPLLIAVLVIGTPFAASAATLPPACTLLTRTPDDEFWPTINNKLYLLATPGEPITIIWGAANATAATDNQGVIGLTGQQVVTPSSTTAYNFHFTDGSQQTTCTVTAVVLGSTGVQQGSVGSTAHTSSTQITTVSAPGTSTSTTVTTGAATASSTPSTASFTASEIPLLTGGTVAPGGSVPVQYLQLVNTSPNTATLPGVWLKQVGSTPLSSIIGFSTVDDKQQFRTSVGGKEGSMLFQNGRAFIPLNASFAPGQLRIFTIKAQVTNNFVTSTGNVNGTTLMLDTDSIDTSGNVTGQFPIFGTTWTLKSSY